MRRIFDPALARVPDTEAADQGRLATERFLQDIGLWTDLADLRVMVLPDYNNNPRIATLEEILEMLESCYQPRSQRPSGGQV